MIRTCFCCGKEYEYKAGSSGLEINGTLSAYKYPCIECCSELGIPSGFKGKMKAGLYSSEKFIKEYIDLHPEANGILNSFYLAKGQKRLDTKAELDAMKARREEKKQSVTDTKSKGKGKKETKHTCLRCGRIWYTNLADEFQSMEASMTLATSWNKRDRMLAQSNIKDTDQCPMCGSRDSKREAVK